jgi:hypothetical protein
MNIVTPATEIEQHDSHAWYTSHEAYIYYIHIHTCSMCTQTDRQTDRQADIEV